MGNDTKPGIDIDEVQLIVDGTMCRDDSPLGGPTGIGLPITMGVEMGTWVYCDFWDASQRKAFLTGFIRRLEDYAGEIKQMAEWVLDATGLGDTEGDFGQAWSNFGDSLAALAEIAWKITVVIGIPLPLIWHPKREEYRQQLFDMGIVLTESIIQGYKDAYEQGGIPQCTGRLYADILVLIVEALVAKGTTKVLKSIKLGKYVPEKLKNKIDETISASQQRRRFVNALRIASHTDAGMPPHHFDAFMAIARDPAMPRIILVRQTNVKCIEWIAKKYPPKPMILGKAGGKKLSTSPKTGFVTCDDALQAADVRKKIKPGTQKKYYVVDKDGKFAIDGDGNKIDLADADWKPHVEPGQVIDPDVKKPVVGDYDLQDVIDPENPGSGALTLATSGGEVVDNFTNPEIKKIAAKLNAKMDQHRVLHGPQEFLEKNDPKDIVIAFFPDGKPRQLNMQQLEEFKKIIKRKTPRVKEALDELKKQALDD